MSSTKYTYAVAENCTFEAMFSSKRDELSDEVHRLLFLEA